MNFRVTLFELLDDKVAIGTKGIQFQLSLFPFRGQTETRG